MPDPLQDDIVTVLADFIAYYFTRFDDDGDPLDAERTKVYLGIYDRYDKPLGRPLNKPLHPDFPKGTQGSFRYRVLMDPVAIPFERDHNDAPRVARSWQPSGQVQPIHLWNSRILVDPAVDDLLEMKAVGFPYADELAQLSTGARAVYKQNLDQIRDRPASLASDAEGVKFIKALARYATYDSDGDYFAKWKPGRQNSAPYEENVTERYIKNSFREVELPAGSVYVLRQNELWSEIDHLYMDKGNLTKGPYTSVRNTRFELTKYRKDTKLHDAFLFVYALGGIPPADKSKHPKPWKNQYDLHNPKGHAAVRRMLDPQRLVEGAVHDDHTGSDLVIRDEYEWFVELVKAYFPSRIYLVNLAEIRKEGWEIDPAAVQAVRALVHDQLMAALHGDGDAVGGPISQKVVEQMLELMKDRDLIVFPQGLKTGDHSRLIGGDNRFMYERDLKNGSVYMVSTLPYIWNLYVGKFAFEVYQATKHLIPMIAVVTWAGVAVMGGAVLGITPATIRAFVIERVEKEAVSAMVRKLIWRFFRPAVASLLVEMLAYVFAAAEGDDDGTAARTAAFAKGFFRGYVVNTLYEHFLQHVVIDLAKNGLANIREVRMYLLVKRAYAAIDRIRDVIHTIENQLDAPAVKRATASFGQVLEHLARGAAITLSTVYYLPHDAAQPILELFHLDPNQKPPDPDVWGAEAQRQLAHITGNLPKLVGLSSIDEALADIADSKWLPALGTVMVLEAELIWGAEYTFSKASPRTKAWVLVALGAIAVGGAIAANEMTDGKVWATTKTLLGDFLHAPRSKEEAEVDGELLGNLFGAVFFNKFMYGKDGLLHGFMEKHPVLGGALWGNTKASVIEAVLALLLKRYVFVYDQLKKVAGPLTTRAGGESAFVAAVHALEDEVFDEQGWGHLKSFRSADENATSLQSIALTIFRVREIIRRDIRIWIQGRYGTQIERYKQDLVAFDQLAKAGGVDFQQLYKDGKNQVEMIYHQMARQLHQAVDELAEAVRLIFEPFTKGGLSWVELLKELGIDVGDTSKLQQTLIDAAKQELAGFKKGS